MIQTQNSENKLETKQHKLNNLRHSTRTRTRTRTQPTKTLKNNSVLKHRELIATTKPGLGQAKKDKKPNINSAS